MPTPIAWYEAANEALDKERLPTGGPVKKDQTVLCSCSCHKFCHTCGNRFLGVPHINCGDTATNSSIVYATK